MGLYFDKNGKLITPIKEGTFTGTVKSIVERFEYRIFPSDYIMRFFMCEIETPNETMKVKVYPGAVDPDSPHFISRADQGMGITTDYLASEKVSFYAVLLEGEGYWICKALMTRRSFED